MNLGYIGNTPGLDHHEKIDVTRVVPEQITKKTIMEYYNISSTLFVTNINQWNSPGKVIVDIISEY